MGDLDRGDAKQRIRATGATKNEDTSFGGAFDSSFASVAAPESDDTASTTTAEAGAGRSVPMPVPISFEDFVPSGGDFDVPYQIRRAAKSGYMIYLPEGCLVVDGNDVAVSKFSGVSKVSGMKGPWYSYPFTQLMAGYLNVTVKKKSGSDSVTVSEVKFTNGSKASSSSDSSSSSGEKTKTYSVAICNIDDYKRPVQVVASAIRITTEATPDTDDKSVETDDENEDKLQLYKFSGTDADGSPGLVQRIKATSDEDGNVTLSASDAGLMFVCRKDGKVVYVPLSGESESSDDAKSEETDPKEESQDEVDEPDPENIDPATPGAEDPSEDPGSSASGSDDCGGGGVSPGGGGGGGTGGQQGYSGCDEC